MPSAALRAGFRVSALLGEQIHVGCTAMNPLEMLLGCTKPSYSDIGQEKCCQPPQNCMLHPS